MDIPEIKEQISNLLQSISREEEALSKLVSSEAKRIDSLLHVRNIYPEDLVEICRTAEQFTASILMKEWLLLRKLETLFHIKLKIEE